MHDPNVLGLIVWLFDSDENRSFLDRLWQTVKDTLTSNIIGAGGVASTLALFYWAKLRGFFRELKKSREDEAHLYNLVPWSFLPTFAPKSRKAVVLLEAINRGALDSLAEDVTAPKTTKHRAPILRRFIEGVNSALSPSLRPEKAKLVWTPEAIDHLRNAQRFFVPPACTVDEPGKSPMTADGIRSLVEWMGESTESGKRDKQAGRFWILASGRSGKTTFMNRLFLELVGRGNPDIEAETPAGGLLPVPMLAAAEMLRPHLQRIEHLKGAKNVLSEFAIAWLDDRNISIPDNKKGAYGKAFNEALTNGEIVLLLDGVDELQHQDLATFTKDLLKLVKFWVASNKPGAAIVPTRRSLSLDEVWTYEQIALSLDRRMPDGSPMAKIRETVKSAVKELIERHDEAVRQGMTDQEHHWLCQTGNFHLFVDSLTPQTTEREIRRLADSQPHLFRQIFDQAVRHIGAEEDMAQIRDRLFDLSVCDPTAPRDGAPAKPFRDNDRIAERVNSLTEITQSTIKGPAFRSAAMREYFLAGRIAREVLDPAVRTDDTDELARNDRWDSAKRDAIISWIEPVSAKKTARLRSRLHRRTEGSPINPTMRRNLLDLLLAFDRQNPLDDIDLSEIPGERIDLKRLTIRNCSFAKARLHDAELSGATFSNCDFSGADLSAADALATRFENCTFDSAEVRDMAIHDAVFSGNGANQRLLLEQRGAHDFRTRYRDEFGDAWPAFQKAALGPEFEQLEDNAYLPRIREAVQAWDSSQPVYLIDLMAGGNYRRVTDLLDEFSNLRILGIDRDPSKHPPHDRLGWTLAELGSPKSNGQDPLGVDLRDALTRSFGESSYPVQTIVGKKALHEIDRALQPKLIERCAEALAPAGRLILFVDAPGPADHSDLDAAELSKIHTQLSTLRTFLGGDPSPAEVLAKIESFSFDGSATSQIGFTNAWIMLKDWVNQNRHEVENRYFASVAEIKDWAAPCLGEPVWIANAKYRLNPLMFNELGIQSVLHHVSVHGASSVTRDRRQLQEMISESERLNVLVEFSRKHLADSDLGAKLGADARPIALGKLDSALSPLDTGARAWSFALNCSVLVFEKGPGRKVSSGQ
jgi:uncharacterized protein YjbI with pentapeptide repeats